MPDQRFDTNPPADRIAEIRARHDSGQLLRRNDFEWLLAEHDRLTSDLTEERAEHFETKEAYAQTSNAGVTYLTRIDKLTAERDAALARVEELEGQLAKARQYQLAGTVAAYVAWEIDNHKRNDLPITHSIADRSEGVLRGCVRTLQDLLTVLGEVEGDEECSETWAILEAAIANGATSEAFDEH